MSPASTGAGSSPGHDSPSRVSPSVTLTNSPEPPAENDMSSTVAPGTTRSPLTRSVVSTGTQPDSSRVRCATTYCSNNRVPSGLAKWRVYSSVSSSITTGTPVAPAAAAARSASGATSAPSGPTDRSSSREAADGSAAGSPPTIGAGARPATSNSDSDNAPTGHDCPRLRTGAPAPAMRVLPRAEPPLMPPTDSNCMIDGTTCQYLSALQCAVYTGRTPRLGEDRPQSDHSQPVSARPLCGRHAATASPHDPRGSRFHIGRSTPGSFREPARPGRT